MKSGSVFTCISTLSLLFTGFSAASPWAEAIGGKYDALLVARQDQSSGGGSTSPTPASTAQNSASASGSSGNGGSSITSSGSAAASSASGSVSGSGSNSVVITRSTARNSTKTTAIDPRLPPGGVSMITPAAIDGMTFVKVGDQVTFAWNYTSLSVPPSYIDVIATNTVNSQTYTIAANQTWQSTQSVVWDTSEWTQTTNIPFVVATYTLMVYDANNEPTTVPSAGYLGAFSNLQFGVYTPQAYTPLNEFHCATCSGAMSLHEKQALGVLIGTCALTVFSFTWFAAGFGVFA